MSNYKKLYLYVPTDNSRSEIRASDTAFSLNSRELSENMVWEHLQNALDARKDDNLPVRIKIKNCSSIKKRQKGKQYWLDLTKQTEEIYKNSFNQTFKLNDQALILQETNTTGLTGEACYKPKPTKKEEAQKWHITNFLYRDGQKSKDGTKRGSTGNGKTTYTYITDLGMFLVISHRDDDGKVVMAGQAFFPKRVEDNANDINRSYWGSFTLEDDEKKLDRLWSDEKYDKVVAPIWDEKIIKEHISFFNLDFDKDIKSETGTTFIFPSPKIKPAEYLKEAVKSFYWAIFRGDLVLEHHSKTIDQDSISDICKEDFKELGNERFFDFLTEVTKFDDNNFIEVQDHWAMENAKNIDLKDFLCSNDKSKIESADNNLIGFKFPLKIDNDTGTKDSFVKVFYQYDSEESKSLVARNDFIISGEESNFFPKYYKGFGLVLIDDDEIFKLVRASEGPDHTKFIKKVLREYIKSHKKYKNGEKVLDQIRSAPKQVIDLFDSKHDAELENFMSTLLSFKKKQEKKKKKTIKTQTTTTNTGGGGTQPPSRQFFKCELEGTTNNYQIHFSKGSSSLASNDLPFKITIRLDSNAHTGFAPTKGIDLGENGFASSTLVNQNNINIIRQNPGEIILEVTDENFQGTLENIDLQHAGDAMLFRS